MPKLVTFNPTNLMLNTKVFLMLMISVMLSSINIKAQVLFNMGNYRNLAYTSYGYNGAFANTTIGIARRDSVKLLKRVVIGILDASLPVTQHFFTRHSLRKAFQIELYKKNDFITQFMFASSSIIRENRYFKFDDITAEFSLIPGLFRKKYSLALDFRYELIVFRHIKYRADYLREKDPTVKSHWESPFFSIAKVGFIAGLNLNHFVIYVKSGYERNPFVSLNFNNFLPGYILAGFGFKFGTRPFK